MPSLTTVRLISMNEDLSLSTYTFNKTCKRLSLLACSESLSLLEQSRLFRAIMRRSQHLLAKVSPQTALYGAYSAWRAGTRVARAGMPYYFQVNLTKLQPFYTTLAGARRVQHTFSTGCILRLYRITLKRDRRKVEKAPLSLRFFKRFFKGALRRSRTTAVCLGYRRRYAFFLSSALVPFARRYASSLVFAPQTLTGMFSFRRVKAIKKRIRKRIGARSK